MMTEFLRIGFNVLVHYFANSDCVELFIYSIDFIWNFLVNLWFAVKYGDPLDLSFRAAFEWIVRFSLSASNKGQTLCFIIIAIFFSEQWFVLSVRLLCNLFDQLSLLHVLVYRQKNAMCNRSKLFQRSNMVFRCDWCLRAGLYSCAKPTYLAFSRIKSSVTLGISWLI